MKSWHIALSSDARGEVSQSGWTAQLAEAREAGLSGLVFWDAAPPSSDVLTSTQAQGLKPVAASYSPGLIEGQAVAMALNEVNKYLDALARAGCEVIVVSEPPHAQRLGFVGRVHEAGARELRDDQWQNLADALNELGARCQARGLRLAFCPAVGSFIETPTELRRLMNMTDASLVGLALDVGAYVYAGGNPQDAISTYQWRLALIRLQDINTQVLDVAVRQGLSLQAAEERGVFCALGRGQIDWSSLFSALAESNYSGYLVLGRHTLPDGPRSAYTALMALLTNT